MTPKRMSLFAVTLLAACSSQSPDRIAADSLSRDLQRVPSDSSATIGDDPRPPAGPRSLASGTVIPTEVDEEINSRRSKAGQIVTTTVSVNVTDGRGRVVIPAGSKVKLAIAEIRESENKSDKTGRLTLKPIEVSVGGRIYALRASAEALDRTLHDRKTNAGDVAKVGAGAAVGAIAGRVIGGSTKGAVIGGVIGGAVGAQRAVETQDRDVVVPAGSRVQLRLETGFTI